MKLIFLFISLALFTSARSQTQRFCSSTNTGTYKISLSDDGSKKVLYQLYDNSGELKKTMQGTWTLRDEGVYGTAWVLTLNWTGLNAGLPSLKFTCQYDGSGSLQAIIDGQNRSWNRCR